MICVTSQAKKERKTERKKESKAESKKERKTERKKEKEGNGAYRKRSLFNGQWRRRVIFEIFDGDRFIHSFSLSLSLSFISTTSTPFETQNGSRLRRHRHERKRKIKGRKRVAFDSCLDVVVLFCFVFVVFWGLIRRRRFHLDPSRSMASPFVSFRRKSKPKKMMIKD